MIKKFAVLFTLCLTFVSCEKTLLGPEPENTPAANFQLLWKTLDENCALFATNGLNWDSLRVVYGSKLSPQTTDAELWNTCAALIMTLNDGHVSLFNKGAAQRAWSCTIPLSKAENFSLDLVKSKYLGVSTVAGAGFITYGRLKNSTIGYIDIASFSGAGSGNGSEWAFDIDGVLKTLADCSALIIDLRNNGGGFRSNVETISSAFIDRTLTYFYSSRKTGPGHHDFGAPIPMTLSPRAGVQRFAGKIALLTNRFSSSGAEITAKIFKNIPNAIQIGDTTTGCFGEVTSVAELPNGWTLMYPCTMTTLADGTSPEGVGIIPDMLVACTKDDIHNGVDKVMEAAITYLSR